MYISYLWFLFAFVAKPLLVLLLLTMPKGEEGVYVKGSFLLSWRVLDQVLKGKIITFIFFILKYRVQWFWNKKRIQAKLWKQKSRLAKKGLQWVIQEENKENMRNKPNIELPDSTSASSVVLSTSCTPYVRQYAWKVKKYLPKNPEHRANVLGYLLKIIWNAENI